MFERVKTFFSQWLPIANQAYKRERDPVIDENSSEAPPSNYSDAPVSKKLRLMPHDGDQNVGNSWGARSKKELEGNGKKWVEFLKKPPPNAGENPNEVRSTEIVRTKTVQYTAEAVEEGTSLKQLEKLSNFGATATAPRTARYSELRMKPKSSLSNGGVNKYNSVHNKLFGSPKKPKFKALMTSVLPNQTNKWAYNSCIRMDEKQSYQALLAQFGPKPATRFSAISPAPLRSPRPGIDVVELDPRENQQLREVLKKSSTPLVDLERESSSPTLRRPASSQINRVNSLEDALALSPQYSANYVSDLKSRYGSKQRDRELMIEKEQIRLKVLSENREGFDDQLEQRLRKQLEVLSVKPVVDEREIEPVPVLPQLTDEMVMLIEKCLGNSGAESEVLCEAFSMPVTRRDLKTLDGLNWLNDQVINFYLTMIMERSKETEGMPKVFAHNTFFYPKLRSGGHASLKRWTRRVDLFEQDYILIPIHLGLHWCMAIIAPKEKTIKYYDSMGGQNMECLHHLKKYMEEESLDKKKTKLDTSQWVLECVEEIPQQMNGSDCGMFACKFADYIARRAKITFEQKHMPYFRRRMVYEIVTKKLIDP